MALPPLSATPHLTRLLAPGEMLVYTARLHPLYGWPWLLAAAVAALPAVLGWGWGVYAIVPATVLFIIYLLPFRNWECAVTNKRLLLRFGLFSLTFNDIPPGHINHLQLKHTVLLDKLHAGHLTLHLQAGNQIHPLTLKYLWHPFTFLQALETLTLDK